MRYSAFGPRVVCLVLLVAGNAERSGGVSKIGPDWGSGQLLIRPDFLPQKFYFSLYLGHSFLSVWTAIHFL